MIKQSLLIVLLWQMSTPSKAQTADSILYADFSSTSLTPVQPISLQQADSNRTYLYTDKKGSKKERLVFERFSRNKIKRSRSAKLLHTSYGAVIGFSTLKTDGYE